MKALRQAFAEQVAGAREEDLDSLRSTEARTLAELERAIDLALRSGCAQDAAGWFQSCGYNLN